LRLRTLELAGAKHLPVNAETRLRMQQEIFKPKLRHSMVDSCIVYAIALAMLLDWRWQRNTSSTRRSLFNSPREGQPDIEPELAGPLTTRSRLCSEGPGIGEADSERQMTNGCVIDGWTSRQLSLSSSSRTTTWEAWGLCASSRRETSKRGT